mgnify:CR=1 FL=1
MTQNENMTNERTDMSQDEMLASILQKLTNTSQSSSSPPPAQNPTGDIVSALLSNPELLSKLPALLSSIKPIIDMLGIGSTGQASVPVSAPAALGTSANPTAKQDKTADSRTALLSAMKPYLSPERQNAVDYIVKLGRLGDILKTL